MAWKASCASCESASTDWQTRMTIGPWRSTRTAKADSAASPRSVENRSRSWPSVSSRTVPTLKRVRSCRRTVPSLLMAIAASLRQAVSHAALTSVMLPRRRRVPGIGGESTAAAAAGSNGSTGARANARRFSASKV